MACCLLCALSLSTIDISTASLPLRLYLRPACVIAATSTTCDLPRAQAGRWPPRPRPRRVAIGVARPRRLHLRMHNSASRLHDCVLESVCCLLSFYCLQSVLLLTVCLLFTTATCLLFTVCLLFARLLSIDNHQNHPSTTNDHSKLLINFEYL